MEEKEIVTMLKKICLAFLLLGGILVILILLTLTLKFSYFEPPHLSVTTITKGEFPFKFDYEIDGKRKTIADSWVFEYVCTVRKLDDEYIKWDVSLKSGRDELILYEKDNVQIIFELDTYPNYYMGFVTMSREYIPYIKVTRFTYEGEIKKGNKSKKEKMGEYDLFHDYQFEWINIEYPDPIVNDFGEDK